jgi:hypothetical protein
MSHIAKVDVEITNLDALETACKAIGLELVRGQQTYRWFGESDEDAPLPDGFTVEDLGHCEHAIRIPGDYRCKGVRLGRDLEYVGYAAYEIGVVKRRDGRPGYLLLWDHWAGGCGLMDFVGGRFDSGQFEHDGRMPKLKQAYARAAALRVAQAQGFRVREEVSANGGIRMFLTK